MRKILSAALALVCIWFATPAHAALPSGYTELEYIESTGTQYIDTGVMLGRDHINTDIKLEYDALIKQNGTSWQVCGTLGDSGIYIGVNGSNIIYYGAGIYDTSTGVRDPFVKCKYINDGKNGIVKVTNLLTNIDIVNLTYTPITKETILPMILFGFSTNETAISSFKMSADMYNAKIYDKDILIRNFIPAKRNSDNVIGMYDTVNNRFYTNAGTGEFIAGPVAEIKIATTKYNETAFGPLNTALQNAISVVDSVVSNTITQAGRIADLQAQKQTRPADDPTDANNAENCPAGKKCLLVEDASGIPHWYEIVENAWDLPVGYTQLQYVENTDDTYISVGITVNSGETFGQDIVMSVSADNTAGYTGIFGGAYFGVKDGYFALSNVIENIPFDTNKHRFLFSTNIGSSANQSLQIDDGEIYTASRNVQSGQVTLFRVLSPSITYWLKAKVYSATYRVNGNVVATLIPARRNSDNVVGMYDTTRNVFLAPTGTLTAGPVAE